MDKVTRREVIGVLIAGGLGTAGAAGDLRCGVRPQWDYTASCTARTIRRDYGRGQHAIRT